MTTRNDIVVTSKTKLADRPIVWREEYTKRALFLKRQFHEVLGPGSYFRWVGHDSETDDEYFVVVGPAKVHAPKASFFAGVRKLPADYAAGGYYFHDMKEAMEYAALTWGVTALPEMRYYDSSDLQGISSKVKQWKDSIEEEERGEDFLREWLKSVKKSEEEPMTEKDNTSPVSYFYQQSDTFPYFVKIAMPQWLRNQTGYMWWDVDDLALGSNSDFNTASTTEPSLQAAKDFALDQRIKRRVGIARMYGDEYVEADFYKVWLVHKGDSGTYVVSIGPYTPLAGNKSFEEAFDKFGAFTWKLNLATQEEINNKVNSLIKEYADKFNVQLTPEDINVPIEENPLVGQITVNTSGRAKIYGSPEWKEQILDHYKVTPGRGMMTQLKKNYKEQHEKWSRELEQAYAVSVENGDAFKNMQPEPPKVDLAKRPYGQQISSSIYKKPLTPEDRKTMSQSEIINKFGFDSLVEAVEHLTTTVMQGAPISDVPNVTTADLAAARAKHMEDIKEGRATQLTLQRKSPSKPSSIKPQNTEQTTEPDAEVPVEKAPVEKAPAVVSKDDFAFEFPDMHADEFGDAFSSTSILGMIKMAEDLDAKGMYKESEGIHKILRKHIQGK